MERGCHTPPTPATHAGTQPLYIDALRDPRLGHALTLQSFDAFWTSPPPRTRPAPAYRCHRHASAHAMAADAAARARDWRFARRGVPPLLLEHCALALRRHGCRRRD